MNENTAAAPAFGVATGPLQNEGLLWEKSRPGRVAACVPASDVPAAPDLAPELAGPGPDWPELSEPDLVRHYTRLSTWNYGVDTGMYPLGSCTMKYNPKINESLAALPGFADAHPLLPDAAAQGALGLIHELEGFLAEIAGLQAATLQPAAGAHGELCGLLMIAAHHRANGGGKTRVLVPDSAHGTNPATAAMCGYDEVKLPLGPDGVLEFATVEKAMDGSVAALMVTNPNTLGLFESDLGAIARLVHERGGLVYADGANFNAIMGRVDLGRLGVDAVHYNLHKSMSTPHGGGGPGSGPVAVGKTLVPYLPRPRVVRDASGRYAWDRAGGEKSIGRLHAFHGQFLTALRAYAYILSLGPELKTASGLAVLNANYVQEKLKDVFDLPHDRRCMHECVFTDAKQRPRGVSTLDVAKRLIDLGFHPPTVYFPLVVQAALMVEPTETESRENLDAFIAAMRQVAREAETCPDLLHAAPTTTKVGRLDETLAARKPVLTGDF